MRNSCQLLLVFTLLFSACAKVADPLPPLVVPPDTASDVETVRLADHLQIVFSLPPQENQWVELYRQCGSPPVSPENAELLTRTKVEEIPRYPDENRVFLEDQPGTDLNCSYWLRFVDGRGLSSPFSNAASTPSE